MRTSAATEAENSHDPILQSKRYCHLTRTCAYSPVILSIRILLFNEPQNIRNIGLKT